MGSAPIANDQSAGWGDTIMNGVGNLLGWVDSMGAESGKEAMEAYGGGAFSNMFTPIQALWNQFTYQPAHEGGWGVAERTAKAGTDLLWGFGAGFTGLLDWVTGAGVSKGLDAGREGVMDVANYAATGDPTALQDYREQVFDGQYGTAASGLGVGTDALAQAYVAATTDGDQTFDWGGVDQAGQGMIQGSWYNPLTWVANGASAITGYATDATEGSDDQQVLANLRNLYASAVQRGDMAGARHYQSLLQQRGG